MRLPWTPLVGIPIGYRGIPWGFRGDSGGFRRDSVTVFIGIPMGFRGIPGDAGGFRMESPGGFHLERLAIRL